MSQAWCTGPGAPDLASSSPMAMSYPDPLFDRSVLRAVAAAQLFDHFKRDDAEAAAQRLVSLVFNKSDDSGGGSALPAGSAAASEVIAALGQVLPMGRPTLQLVVQATLVRDLNVGEDGGGSAWERGGAEEQMLRSDPDSEEGENGLGLADQQQGSSGQSNNPLVCVPYRQAQQSALAGGAYEAWRPSVRCQAC